MKKLLSIMLAVMLLLSMAACGDEPADATTTPKNTVGDPKDGTTAPAGAEQTTAPVDNRPVITVGLPICINVQDLEENALTNWIEEEFSVNLKFTGFVDDSDIGTQIATVAAVEKYLPDILFGVDMSKDQISKFIEDGYFWDLTPYFDDKEGATVNFWSRITESLTEEQQNSVVETITDPATGKVYSVPTVETTGNADGVDMICKPDTFISKDCADPDLSFEILMALWSWEGSMRVRFGEPDVNWCEADPLPYKVISDPLTQQNTAHWGTVACCFVEYVTDEAGIDIE